MEVKTDERIIVKDSEKPHFDLSRYKYTCPENYKELEMREIKEIIPNIDELDPMSLRVFIERFVNTLYFYLDAEKKRIIENWLIFLERFLYPYLPSKRAITLGEEYKIFSVKIDSTSLDVSVSKFEDPEGFISDVFLIIRSLPQILIVSDKKYREKIQRPISPLLYPSKDDEKLATLLRFFLSQIIYSIEYKSSISRNSGKGDWYIQQQKEFKISGYFSVLEILEILEIYSKEYKLRPLVNNLIESIYTRLKSIFSDLKPTRSTLERLCDLTWPLTAYVLNKYALLRLTELNLDLQKPSYQTY